MLVGLRHLEAEPGSRQKKRNWGQHPHVQDVISRLYSPLLSLCSSVSFLLHHPLTAFHIWGFFSLIKNFLRYYMHTESQCHLNVCKEWNSPSQASAICEPWTSWCSFKLVLEKAEEPEIKLPTSAGSWKKQESSRKTSISALLTMPKPLSVWFTINCGKFWKRWEYQTTWPASWETYMQVRKQQLELDMEQQTGSK